MLLPGIQGRWEWMAPAVDALRHSGVVLTFSLGDDTAADGRSAFDVWTDAIDRRLADAGIARAILIGHSFGGLPAIRYAARRPDRVAGLVLISTPAPRYTLSRTDRVLVRHPLLTFPLFVARGAVRMAPEVLAARPSWGGRLRLFLPHLWRVLRAPASPVHMAAWVRAWLETDLEADCRAVTAPTLLVTGEPGLDRVVPVESSLAYLALLPGARHVAIPRTGHLLPVAAPEALAQAVDEFCRTVVSRGA